MWCVSSRFPIRTLHARGPPMREEIYHQGNGGCPSDYWDPRHHFVSTRQLQALIEPGCLFSGKHVLFRRRVLSLCSWGSVLVDWWAGMSQCVFDSLLLAYIPFCSLLFFLFFFLFFSFFFLSFFLFLFWSGWVGGWRVVFVLVFAWFVCCWSPAAMVGY